MKRPIKKLNRVQTLLILSLVLFGTMIGIGVFSDEGVMTVYQFREELDLLKGENEALVHENKDLVKEIEALKTDPLSIETIAREKLQLTKPGEVVYQIVPPSPAS